MSAMHAIDLDDDALRDALVDTMRAYDPASRQMARARAEVILAAVYRTLSVACEDLEPMLAELRANTARLTLAAQHSAGRRAALEHALGIERAVRGEVVSTASTHLDTQETR